MLGLGAHTHKTQIQRAGLYLLDDVHAIGVGDSEIGIGDTYDHRVEEDGQLVTKYGSAFDSPWDMVNYPDVTRGNVLSIGPLTISSTGDVLISFSASAHLIFGGHASASFNITEYIRRLFD